jgi:uncharacterized protein YkwD
MLAALRIALLSVFFCVAACGGAKRPPAPPPPREARASSASKHPPRIHEKREPAPLVRPSKPLPLAEARKYFLRLINRDREREGLEPVVLDATAQKAAQEHADDMAGHGYTAHYGTDGSVPEMRYSAAGGTDIAFENAACFFDNTERRLDKGALFLASELERIESAFIDEKPPHDGHRRNILTPWHNRVGIGLAQPLGITVPCVAQEFVDHYGKYEAIPSSAAAKGKIRVTGEVFAPATFGAVALARIDRPEPRTPDDLNGTGSYQLPAPYAIYLPKGFVTPIEVRVDGNRFSVEVPLDDRGRAGIYEVSVWGRVPETSDLITLSLRTVAVK